MRIPRLAPSRDTQAEEQAKRLERIAELRTALEAPGPAAQGDERTKQRSELADLEAQSARHAARVRLTYETMLVEGFDKTVRADPPRPLSLRRRRGPSEQASRDGDTTCKAASAPADAAAEPNMGQGRFRAVAAPWSAPATAATGPGHLRCV